MVIAAPASASGKTLVTLGLLRHLKVAGLRVASAKVGPDYIDPRFHAAASGSPCVTLDPWAMREVTLANQVLAQAEAEMIIAEGVMGLFDGAAGEMGSTADLAETLGWPVVLVADVRAQGASAAALVEGFARHRPGLTLAGIILNRVGSPRHREIIETALEAALPHVARLGAVPRVAGLEMPSRHLGLVQAEERGDLEAFLDQAADVVGGAVDTSALMDLARPAAVSVPGEPEHRPPIPPVGQRISVARDVAFAFSYPHVLEAWRDAGAEVRLFSPLADEAPAADSDAVYLPGGYPELHAGPLAGNAQFLEGLRSAAARGGAVYGECGGYMVLGEGLVDAGGARHAMAGLLPLETSFAEPRLHLGYRQVRTVAGGPLGPKGTHFKAHEFHYASVLTEAEGAALFEAANAEGTDLGSVGLRRGSVFGSFIHLIDRV